MIDINIEADDLAVEVRRLAEKEPDFNYAAQGGDTDSRGCSYLGRAVGDSDGRACIVGQAMQNLGVPEHKLLRVEGYGVGDILGQSHSSVQWMMSVQDRQDAGDSWGDAVESADDLQPTNRM